jgi:hypothetical protein
MILLNLKESIKNNAIANKNTLSAIAVPLFREKNKKWGFVRTESPTISLLCGA